VTEAGPRDPPRRLTRRRFLVGASALAAGGAAIGVAVAESGGQGRSLPAVTLPPPAPGLPIRQHAWGATEARDDDGNPIAPRFDRLLFFDVNGSPTPGYARVLEASLRNLERAYAWGPSGLLFTVGWSPDYFQRRLGIASPIPRAKALSDFELPAIDTYDCCVHLAGDDEQRLAAVEAALVHGAPVSGVHTPLDLSSVLSWRETRTGFTGPGLPAARQNVGGIPPGDPVSKSSPLFMGFKSNLKRNQATEDDVTIGSGAFAEGTTMHVSYMRLRLDSWYQDLSYRERVARMYAPQVTPREVAQFTTDAESDPNMLGQAINRYGVIGHAQTSARARRNGKPLIIRRDFNTVDGGQAGLHFVAVQRTIEDFVTTRTAMNASSAQLQNPAITATVNNGINEFIFVLKRANYILPPRSERSFPLLAGRSGALGTGAAERT
jgi:dye decolorizing peroxidase